MPDWDTSIEKVSLQYAAVSIGLIMKGSFNFKILNYFPASSRVEVDGPEVTLQKV